MIRLAMSRHGASHFHLCNRASRSVARTLLASGRSRALPRELFDQWLVSREVRLRLEAVPCAGDRPRQLLAGIHLDERLHPRMLVEHCWAQVDEEVEAVRLR